MNTSYYEYYKRQTTQAGAGPVFVGPMIQRGYGLGNIFRSLFSFIRPVLKPAATFLGRTLLSSGADVIRDVAGGAKWKDAAKERLSQAGNRIAETAGQKIADFQRGNGTKRKAPSGHRPQGESIKRRRTALGHQSLLNTYAGKTSDILDHYDEYHGSDDE